MANSYRDEEARIHEAISYADKLNLMNITRLASNFNVPYQRLRDRLHGRDSRSTRNPTNRILTDY